MDTSIAIIGLVLTILIALPIFYSIRSNSMNKSKIEKIKAEFSQNNRFKFETTETLNKKVLALDEKNKGFLLMDFNLKSEKNSFVDLNDIQTSKLVVTKDNGGETIAQIDLEFHYKENKKIKSVPFYKIENDQMGQLCLYEDHQLAKKYKQIIDNCISI